MKKDALRQGILSTIVSLDPGIVNAFTWQEFVPSNASAPVVAGAKARVIILALWGVSHTYKALYKNGELLLLLLCFSWATWYTLHNSSFPWMQSFKCSRGNQKDYSAVLCDWSRESDSSPFYSDSDLSPFYSDSDSSPFYSDSDSSPFSLWLWLRIHDSWLWPESRLSPSSSGHAVLRCLLWHSIHFVVVFMFWKINVGYVDYTRFVTLTQFFFIFFLSDSDSEVMTRTQTQICQPGLGHSAAIQACCYWGK